jgi:hypothetical protein
MDFVQAKIDIMNWITGFVEKPNADLDGWAPCPHARKARLQGQLDIRQGQVDPYTDLMNAEMGDFMVIGYVYDPKNIDAEQFENQVRAVNRGFLVPRDIIALADHPDSPEIVKGVSMNQGTWAIAFIQPLSKLNEFSRLIAGKNYYDGWPEEYLQGLFEFREDPRK